MEFDWTTFALEILNFLVLVWILTRFLYRPVTRVIAERKAGIERTLADAQAAAAEAQALKGQYEGRMGDWEQEKAQARAQLREEIDAERTRLMAGLQAALEQERAKASALERQRSTELRRKLEADAWREGARFVARLLARIASPELEERIRGLVLEDLPHLTDRDLHALQAAAATADAKIAVTSAYPLGEAQRNGLARALRRLTERPVPVEFREDTGLMAGVRIGIGPWVLRSNLRDELSFFAEAQHAAR
jgi:F-type H+-transporting ATPase subunit b